MLTSARISIKNLVRKPHPKPAPSPPPESPPVADLNDNQISHLELISNAISSYTVAGVNIGAELTFSSFQANEAGSRLTSPEWRESTHYPRLRYPLAPQSLRRLVQPEAFTTVSFDHSSGTQQSQHFT